MQKKKHFFTLNSLEKSELMSRDHFGASDQSSRPKISRKNIIKLCFIEPTGKQGQRPHYR